MHERPPRHRRQEEDLESSDGKYPARKLRGEERRAKREIGGALPAEKVIPVEPKEELPTVAEVFAAAEAQEKPQEAAEVKPPKEAAVPVPAALAEIYGDKIPPADEIEKYNKFAKDPKKQEGFVEHLKAERAKKEAREARKANKKKKKEEAPKPAEAVAAPVAEVAEPVAETESAQELTQEQKDAELLRKIREEDEAGDKKRAEAREQATEEVLENLERSFGVEVDTIDAGHTPKEWKDKLKEAVGKIEDLEIQGKPELSGSAKKNEIYNRRRLKDLDEQVRELGVVEKKFRSWGEMYNKLGWKSKLAVGGALVTGAAASSAFAFPTALTFCVGGLVAQRVAGLSSMFQQIEKQMQEAKEAGEGKKEAAGFLSKREWFQKLSSHLEGENQKRAAMLTAIGWTVGMGYTINKAIEHGADVFEWIKEHVHHGGAAVSEGAHAGTAEIQQPAAAAAAGEHAHEAAAGAKIEMPTVGATRGHGYEYMMKRLWEQLQEKHVTLPANADPNSDLYKLLHADEKTLDTVVHRIAGDMDKDAVKHSFFNTDGTSIRIDPSAHMTIGTDGQIHFSDATHPDIVQATSDMHTTPALHHEAPVVPAEAPAPVESHVRLEPPVVEHAEPHIAEVSVTQEERYIIPKPTHNMGPEVSPHDMGPSFTIDGDIAKTHFGLEVPLKEPHVYLGWDKHFFVYGGDAQSRVDMVQSYLLENPSKVVYTPDNTGTYRVPWYLSEGKAVPGTAVRTRGLFGFFGSFMKAPDPGDMKELIK